jgi:hypothetical protein
VIRAVALGNGPAVFKDSPEPLPLPLASAITHQDRIATPAVRTAQ